MRTILKIGSLVSVAVAVGADSKIQTESQLSA